MANAFKKIILAAVSGILLVSCSKTTDFELAVPDFYPSALVETSKKTSDGKIKFYKFQDEQKIAFKNFFDKNKDAAVFVQIKNQKIQNDASFDFGFFYDEDADLASLSKRPVVSGKFGENSSLALSLCLEKSGKIPAGFFVKSAESFKIENASIIRACIGHDFSGEIPVFAFGPNGGVIMFPARDDFTGGSAVFSSVNTNESVMPFFKIKFASSKDKNQNQDENSENQNPKKNVKIAFGGETLTIRASSDSESGSEPKTEEIFSGALKTPFSIATYPDGDIPDAIMMMAGDASLLEFSSSSRNPLVPIKTDPGLIMSWSRNMWRGNDYELFEWDRFPGVLIMDISTYAVQDDFLRRIAFFVEKSGYKGRLMADAFLKNQHGYNAHDYRAESLADFFEKVRAENFPINEREKLLREILLKNGIIIEESDGKIAAGRGAVISISQESSMYLRTTFIAHEGWHGIYFVDEDFRNAVASVYYTLDDRTLAYLKRYFQVTPTLNYDVNDDYLMKNEFMAYMLQRPLSQTAKYFVDMARREHSQQLAKEEAVYIIQTNAAGFAGAATLLDEYVNGRWNLNAGRVWLISR